VLAFFPSYVVLSSPKNQTLPAASCAYHSKVSSTACPRAAVTTRCTTVVGTPCTSRVRSVTVTVVVSAASSPAPR
jgi:hypothetical protein